MAVVLESLLETGRITQFTRFSNVLRITVLRTWKLDTRDGEFDVRGASPEAMMWGAQKQGSGLSPPPLFPSSWWQHGEQS